jgi:predicted RNA-binding Zn ribbon-like protein
MVTDEIPAAGHLALDFLNTRVGIGAAEPREHIGDGAALAAWLLRAGAAAEAEADGFRGADLDALAASARAVREVARTAVAAWKARGALPSDALLARLNGWLASAGTRRSIARRGRALAIEETRVLAAAEALLAPVAEGLADLFAHADRRLARVCAADDCSLWFYDRTKAHRRRWCSMAVCGARAKARAYRRRRT